MDINVIRELFNDVNIFLVQTLSGETLSDHAEEKREALLKRISLHLPPSSSPITTSPYLDMNGSVKGKDQGEEYVDVDPSKRPSEDSECYEEFPEQQPPISLQSVETEDNNQRAAIHLEKMTISTSKLQKLATKYGPLSRKGKLLFIEHFARCWAGITGDVMIIYNGEKDTKPCEVLHLHGYEARPAPSCYPKDPKKRDSCFEIVCPGKKTHQFIARTAKDMEQWMVCINDEGQRNSNIRSVHLSEEPVASQGSFISSTKRQLPSPPSSSSGSDTCDEYDDVNALTNEYGQQYYDDEEIYHDISEIISDAHSVIQEENIPLPPRRPVPKSTNEDTSDHDSVYDDVGLMNNDNFYHNVQGQNEGTTKETPITQSFQEVRQVSTATQKILSEEKTSDNFSEEDIYDDIGASEKNSEPTKSMFRQESTNSLGRIHQIIQKIELLGSSRHNSVSNNLKSDLGRNTSTSTRSIPSEMLYEPIHLVDEESSDLKLHRPPRKIDLHL